MREKNIREDNEFFVTHQIKEWQWVPSRILEKKYCVENAVKQLKKIPSNRPEKEACFTL